MGKITMQLSWWFEKKAQQEKLGNKRVNSRTEKVHEHPIGFLLS